MTKPLAIDLYCGLGGWTEGFLAEGYRVIGFDLERHDYGFGVYPGELVLRDVRSIHGSEFKDAAVIVGSSPCHDFSYRAMPWKRAKALGPPYLGMELFQAQFRIQREACEAAGRYIPMVVENVRGAQKWVGRARWHFGSYYLWGDVPALMPMTFHAPKMAREYGDQSSKIWSERPSCLAAHREHTKVVAHLNVRDGHSHTRHLTNQREHLKVPGIKLSEVGFNVAAARSVDLRNKPENFKQTADMKRQHIGYSRKAASTLIAKIPFPLAQHIARCFKPRSLEATA